MAVDFIVGDWVYDIETYPNCFTFATCYASGAGKRVFEISSRKDETQELLAFLRKVKQAGHRMVGFNNLGFDYPVVHHILKKSSDAVKGQFDLRVTPAELYRVAMKIIEQMKTSKFGANIRASDVMLRQVDLFKVHHFDNAARMTSLKMLEFNMRSDSIEDLPFPVGTVLTDEEMDVLIHYNFKDVAETLKFYYHSLPALRLRAELTEQFGFDCTNYNDTKIGKELFVNRLEKNRPGCCFRQTSNGKKMMQTKRPFIRLAECILPYVQFERPEFTAVRNWFAEQVITETKGVFLDIEEHKLGEVAKYAEMVTKKKKLVDPVDKKNKRYIPTEEHLKEFFAQHPLGWIEEKELKSPKGFKSYHFCWNIAKNLNVVIDGFRYDFGTGGIHGCKKGITVKTPGKKIKTIDVASYYPNLSIKNKIYPQHLDVLFCDVYGELYVERRSYHKTSALNKALKLALNGTYGASGDEFSPMYDPKFMMSITINGQLSLCMLMETLIQRFGVEIIMCNTDGFEYVINEEDEEAIEQCVKEWEDLTGLTMEGDEYTSMMAANVNNYVAVYASGDVKRKGAYEYENLDWHKNQSALVIKMAAVHELLGKGCSEDFIRNHKDEYDFMLRTKVPRSSRLVMTFEDEFEPLGYKDVALQNICRYYPSIEGGKLIKIMPPLAGKELEGDRRLSIDKDWNVTVCNNMVDFKWGVNYDYYFTEARKLINAIQGDEELDDEFLDSL